MKQIIIHVAVADVLLLLSCSCLSGEYSLRNYDKEILRIQNLIKSTKEDLSECRPLAKAFIVFSDDIRKFIKFEGCDFISQEGFSASLTPPIKGIQNTLPWDLA